MKINILNNFTNSKYFGIHSNSKVSSYPNLGALKKDTVSFSARAQLLGTSMCDAPAVRDCYQVSQNAEPSRYYLEKVLDKYVFKLLSPNGKEGTPTRPVVDYYTRTKSAASIREKVVSKYNKTTSSDTEDFATYTIDELIKKFPLVNGVSRDYLISEAKKALNDFPSKIAPFQKPQLFFDLIIDIINETGAMDFSSVTVPELATIKSTILDKLTTLEKTEHLDSNHAYVNPQSIKGIKHYANDIVGARIILDDSHPNDTNMLLTALKRAVKDGYIKINSIENNVPDPAKLPKGKKLSNYQYASKSQLVEFADETGAELIENMSKSGYLALHLNIELTDPLLSVYRGSFSGYSAEIQIIGRDVELLKEVEDLCYKIKDNKNALHVAYKPFIDHFKKYYKGDAAKAFDEYTYALYLAQRDLMGDSEFSATFPSIEDLGFEGKVPKELDFNILKKIKDDCYENLCKQLIAENDKANSTSNDKERIRLLKNIGDIHTVRSLINAKFS